MLDLQLRTLSREKLVYSQTPSFSKKYYNIDFSNKIIDEIILTHFFFRYERLIEDKVQVDLELSHLRNVLDEDREEVEQAMIQADVWRSKFLASRYTKMVWEKYFQVFVKRAIRFNLYKLITYYAVYCVLSHHAFLIKAYIILDVGFRAPLTRRADKRGEFENSIIVLGSQGVYN